MVLLKNLLADFQKVGFVADPPLEWEIVGYTQKRDAEMEEGGPAGVHDAYGLGNMQLAGKGPRAALEICPQRINDIRFDIARVIDDFALTIASIKHAKIKLARGESSPIIVPVRPANQEPFYLWTPNERFWPAHIDWAGRGGSGRYQVEMLTQMLLQGMLLRGTPRGHSQFARFHHESPWHEEETDKSPQLLLRSLFEILRSKVQPDDEGDTMRHGDLELFTANRFHYSGLHITFNPVTTCATFSRHYERYYLIEGFWDAVLENAGIPVLEHAEICPHAELDYVLKNHIEEAHKCTF
jgi:hypothetical protein